MIEVQHFARLVDYIGLWAIEDAAGQALAKLAGSMDLAAHMEAAYPAPRSLVENLDTPAGRIAAIRLSGVLTKSQNSFGGSSTIQVRRDLRQAAADPNVAGILLLVDSPGGTVAGTDELAKDVKAAAKSKPLWGHIEDLGASAAYWALSQADRITANSPTALIGSIGTMQVVRDESAASEKAGIKTLVFATGPLKGTGTPGSKVTDEQIAHLQGLVETVQGSFDAAVQKGRGLTASQLAAVRHGGVLTATEAQGAKLIDAVQPLTKTIAEFSEALKSARAPAGQAGAGMLPMVAWASELGQARCWYYSMDENEESVVEAHLGVHPVGYIACRGSERVNFLIGHEIPGVPGERVSSEVVLGMVATLLAAGGCWGGAWTKFAAKGPEADGGMSPLVAANGPNGEAGAPAGQVGGLPPLDLASELGRLRAGLLEAVRPLTKLSQALKPGTGRGPARKAAGRMLPMVAGGVLPVVAGKAPNGQAGGKLPMVDWVSEVARSRCFYYSVDQHEHGLEIEAYLQEHRQSGCIRCQHRDRYSCLSAQEIPGMPGQPVSGKDALEIVQTMLGAGAGWGGAWRKFG